MLNILKLLVRIFTGFMLGFIVLIGATPLIGWIGTIGLVTALLYMSIWIGILLFGCFVGLALATIAMWAWDLL